MALTQLKTGAIADDAVTTDKLANAINTERTGKIANVVEDTSPQLGADLDVNDFNIKNGTSLIDITDGGRIEIDIAGTEVVDINSGGVDIGTGHVTFPDDSKAKFGAGSDLQIYHDGTNSHLTNSTGYVLVNSTGGDLALRSSADVYLQPASGETSVVGKANGATEIYYDNTKKVQTESAGITVFGSTQVDGTCHPYSDNASDLGLSGNRWQDLYLSGQIYLGGTGASNSLEDYEEGTFSPSFGGDSGGGSYTYSRQAGKYTKIGNAVFFQLYVTVNTVNSNASGNTMVNGLPFTPTGSNDYNGCCIGYYNDFNGIVPSQALVDISQTRLYLYRNNNTSSVQHSVPTDVQNNTSLIISGHYYAA